MSGNLKAEVRRIFDKQRANRWKVAEMEIDARRHKLRRLKVAIIANREAIARAIYDDFRKPVMEVELTEIHPAIDEIKFAIRHLGKWMAPKPVRTPVVLLGARSEIRYEPKGIVLIFAPWNYPFALLVNPLVAAIAAGNCVVVKPSEKTPHLSALFERLVRETFDEEEVAVVQGAAEAGDALLEMPFDHIFFTGSTRIGRKVAEAAGRNLASVTLELGGKSPALVDESARIKEAARRIVWGKFVNSGQTCIAPDYVFVPRSREKELIEAVKSSIETAYGLSEEARQASSDFCRLIDQGSFGRIKGLIDQSVAAGAKIEIGGTFNEATRYIAPTVLSDVRIEHAIMGEEIFGPVLPILGYGEWDEVYDYIRGHGKPLALYLFSENSMQVEEVLRKTSAGGTVINQALLHYANPYLPFGGIGESGQGSYHGFFGFKAFSHERAVLKQRGPSLTSFFFPPYGRRGQLQALQALRRLE